MSNIVFIATSIDGYIADKSNNIDFLNTIENPNNEDTGYLDFIKKIDAIVMGRKTYEKVLSFNIPWPYTKPVYVLSSSLKDVPNELEDKVYFMKGDLKEICGNLSKNGYNTLYIDGGNTISAFLDEDLIDEMIISTIPIVLGSGVPLFSEIDKSLVFKVAKVELLLNQFVTTTYKRKR